LNGGGILIRVAHPARLALHKLAIDRPGDLRSGIELLAQRAPDAANGLSASLPRNLRTRRGR